MKNKGIIELMIGVVIFLIFFIFYITTQITNASALKRNVAENNLLLAGSKVETYVRSFLESMRISLMQSIYDASNAYAEKDWQCYGNNCLSGACSMTSLTKDILEGNKNLKLNGTTGYLNYSYLPAYKDFAKSNLESKLIIADKIDNPSAWTVNDNYLYVRWQDMSFKYCDQKLVNDCTPDSKVSIDRKFTPETNVSTIVKQMYAASSDFISKERLLKEAVMPALKSAAPQASCTGSNSCRSGPVSETDCGSCPSSDEVYRSNYGKSMGATENEMSTYTAGNMDTLQNGITANIYKFEFLKRAIRSDVSASCSSETDGCCRESCSTSSDGETTCVCVADYCTTTCTYDYYNDAKSMVNVTELVYPKYALWDGSNVIQDNLHLKYGVTAGNGGALSCNLLT